jgi:hypothetical protein
MIRRTSIAAYSAIRDSPIIGRIQWRIYAHLYHHGPKTSGEVYRSLRPPHKTPSQIRARFTELRELGVLREVGERSCRITGRRCILWDVTNNLPKQKKKGPRCPSARTAAYAAREIRRAMRKERSPRVLASVRELLTWAVYEARRRRRKKPC